MQLFKVKQAATQSKDLDASEIPEQVPIMMTAQATKSQTINASEPPDTSFELWGWPDPQYSRECPAQDQTPARSGSERQQQQGKTCLHKATSTLAEADAQTHILQTNEQSWGRNGQYPLSL